MANPRIIKGGLGKARQMLFDEARLSELLSNSGDKALPLMLPRANFSSDFINQQAERVARQMAGEHVVSGKPKETFNLAGRSKKESQRVKGLNYKLSPTGTVAQEVPYTPRRGDLKVAVPGDQTVSNKILDEVNGFPIDSVQEGGAYYGLGQRHLADPEFWKSSEEPAKRMQSKVDRVAELYEPDRVIGSHLAMGPMSNNFAMHLADANLRAVDWSKAQPNKINIFDSIIAYGYKDPKTGEMVKFPNWPGLADREGALTAMKEDANLRKWFNDRMKTPNVTKPLGLPNGLDIQYAITEPRLRDMEINMTGLMTGELQPGALVEAAGTPHNTYSHRILGKAGGPQEVLTPFVIDFPDAAQHIASTKKPAEFTGTIQKVFPHQLVDDQYLNQYGEYRDRIKELTGQKKGGAVDMEAADARLAQAIQARMAKGGAVDIEAADARLEAAINARMAGGGEAFKKIEFMAGGGKLKALGDIGKRFLADSDVLPAAERQANKAKFLEPSQVTRRLYHGTGSDISEFRPNTYFSDDPKIAGMYAKSEHRAVEGSGPNIIPVRVQLKNPYVFDENEARKKELSLGRTIAPDVPILQRMSETFKRLKDKGHDGVILKNFDDIGGRQSQYIVFDPKTIKSDVGNRGTYDLEESDITKAKGGLMMAGGGDPLDQFSPPRYRSAGRRPESQNDRKASANMPVDFARGVVSGIGGTPGDIESLIRMIPGLERSRTLSDLVTGNHRETYLPTSEEIEKRLPFKSDTPAGQAASGLGTLVGGFYSGPGAPIRLVGGLPKAVYKAGKDFARASGQPATRLDVYHGSPHKFDRFDASKIGTGEGNQAYGHGLYTAEAPDVAKEYANMPKFKLATIENPDVVGRGGKDFLNRVEKLGSVERASQEAQELLKAMQTQNIFPSVQFQLQNELELAQKYGAKLKLKPTGIEPQIYKVDLPDEQIAKMLDWDKPLSEQPDVMKALKGTDYEVGVSQKEAEKIADMRLRQEANEWAEMTGGDPVDYSNNVDWEKYVNQVRKESGRIDSNITGKDLHSMVMRDEGYRPDLFDSENYQVGASETLRGMGIPGIKYLDATSRDAGKGTRNFVTFPGEEQSMTILERNGQPMIAPAPEGMAHGGLLHMADAGSVFKGVKNIGKRFMADPAESSVASARRGERTADQMGGLNIVKETGGNFLTGRTAKDLQPLKRNVGRADETRLNANTALNNWIDSNLTNYVEKQMGTANDPVRLMFDKRAQEIDAKYAKDIAKSDRIAQKATKELDPRKQANLMREAERIKAEANIERQTAVNHISHKPSLLQEYSRTAENVKKQRMEAGFSEEGVGQSPIAKAWERASDEAIATHRAGDIQGMPEKYAKLTEAENKLRAARDNLDYRFANHLNDAGINELGMSPREVDNLIRGTSYDEKAKMVGDTEYLKASVEYQSLRSPMMDNYMGLKSQNPWIEKVAPETQVYAPFTGDLGFDHIMDVLREDLTTGRIRPDQLNKFSMEQAVRRTSEYDQELAAKMNASRATAREGLPTYREYPEGYKWIQLNKPGAFAQESEAMGHSVRGYEPPKGHPDWTEASGNAGSSGYGHGGWEAIKSGKAKVYSLVDPKGAPHATVEVGQHNPNLESRYAKENLPELYAKYSANRNDYFNSWPDFLKKEAPELLEATKSKITQIKGKGNRAPNEEYLPYVQDFVKGGQWSDVGDLQHTGLRNTSDVFGPTEMQKFKENGIELPSHLNADEQKAMQDKWYTLETGKDPDTGMAHGGGAFKKLEFMADGGKLVKGLGSIGKKLFAGSNVLPAAEREANLAKMLEVSKVKERLYHGTGKDIQKFDKSKLRRTAFGEGFHLAESPNLANFYANQFDEGQNVMPVYAAIKNPYELKSMHDWYDIPGANDTEKTNLLKSQGYDGIKYPHGAGDDKTSPSPNVYVAFEPEQIKSAIGNRGTYDITDPDISKAEGGPAFKKLQFMDDGGIVSPEENITSDQKPNRFSRVASEMYDEYKQSLANDYERLKASAIARAQLAKIAAAQFAGGLPDLASLATPLVNSDALLSAFPMARAAKIGLTGSPSTGRRTSVLSDEKTPYSLADYTNDINGNPIGGSEDIIKRAQKAGLMYGGTRMMYDAQEPDPSKEMLTMTPKEYEKWLNSEGRNRIDFGEQITTGRFSPVTEIGASILGGGLGSKLANTGKKFKKGFDRGYARAMSRQAPPFLRELEYAPSKKRGGLTQLKAR